MKHYEVVAAVIEYDNKILCMQRDKGKFDYVSYKFEFPGGKVEAGEENHTALERELNEEMGVAESDIKIHDGILLAIENQGYDSNGNFLYGIEVVKRVDINTDDINSQEDLIDFEKVKIADLPNTKLYPEVIKNWVINTFGTSEKSKH